MTESGITSTFDNTGAFTVSVTDRDSPPEVAVTVTCRSTGTIATDTLNTAESPFMTTLAGTVAVVGSELVSAIAMPAAAGADVLSLTTVRTLRPPVTTVSLVDKCRRRWRLHRYRSIPCIHRFGGGIRLHLNRERPLR